MMDKRTYKLKRASYECFCPLCATPRQMKYRKNLQTKQYGQLAFTTAIFTYALFPLIGAKAVFTFFLLWPAFEILNKSLYRKELPCPHCGFDATWYKRDVKVARRLVKEFWDKKEQTQVPS